jgi:hypothetical protein
MNRFSFAALSAALLLIPTQSLACACGCSVFDVGAGELMPTSGSGVAFVEYDDMNQTTNWSGTHRAPAAENADKRLRSSFFNLGVEYMPDKDWSVMIELPVTDRLFATDDGSGVGTFRHAAVGDVRLQATYSGFSSDMSTGLTLGMKLPTGDFRYPGFDRDSAIGSGSTDLILGGYHVGQLYSGGRWSYFVQALAQIPIATQDGYRPGVEADAAVGLHYNAAAFADGRMKLTPSLQLIASTRARDAGPAADPVNSGYERLLISPGVALDVEQWRVYADVEVPLYQEVRGDQLTAPVLFKMMVSRSF